MYLQQSDRLVQTGSVIVSHGSMEYAAQSRLEQRIWFWNWKCGSRQIRSIPAEPLPIMT